MFMVMLVVVMMMVGGDGDGKRGSGKEARKRAGGHQPAMPRHVTPERARQPRLTLFGVLGSPPAFKSAAASLFDSTVWSSVLPLSSITPGFAPPSSSMTLSSTDLTVCSGVCGTPCCPFALATSCGGGRR